jgi:hypothetical protein
VPVRMSLSIFFKVRVETDLSLSSSSGTDVIKDNLGGKLPSGRPFRPDDRGRPPASAFAQRTGFYRPCRRWGASSRTPMSAQMQTNVRADAKKIKMNK